MVNTWCVRVRMGVHKVWWTLACKKGVSRGRLRQSSVYNCVRDVISVGVRVTEFQSKTLTLFVVCSFVSPRVRGVVHDAGERTYGCVYCTQPCHCLHHVAAVCVFPWAVDNQLVGCVVGAPVAPARCVRALRCCRVPLRTVSACTGSCGRLGAHVRWFW